MRKQHSIWFQIRKIIMNSFLWCLFNSEEEFDIRNISCIFDTCKPILNKKMRKAILLISLIICSIPNSHAHKFYVSLTEIRYYMQTKSFEISMRLFPDDLDLAISNITGINPQLATKLEHQDADQWARDYIFQHFGIFADDEKLAIHYIGKEAEGDAIWIYMETSCKELPTELRVLNSMLTESFEDQKNIVQLYIADMNKGWLFDLEHTENTLQVTQNIIDINSKAYNP